MATSNRRVRTNVRRKSSPEPPPKIRRINLPVAILIIAIALVAGGLGYGVRAIFQNGTSNYVKPGEYTATLTASQVTLNSLFINWQGNTIYLNVTNSGTTVTQTVTFFFTNGTTPLFAETFNPSVPAGITTQLGPFGGWAFDIRNLATGSTIRVEI